MKEVTNTIGASMLFFNRDVIQDQDTGFFLIQPHEGI